MGLGINTGLYENKPALDLVQAVACVLDWEGIRKHFVARESVLLPVCVLVRMRVFSFQPVMFIFFFFSQRTGPIGQNHVAYLVESNHGEGFGGGGGEGW